MADSESIKERIIASVFTKLNATGQEERYVAHVKIWEEAEESEGGQKPRYILLSRATSGGAFLRKSKSNSNGSFSVGKTWRLNDLRGVEVVNPLVFKVTIARTYRWTTENEHDQADFVSALIHLFRTVVGPTAPLQVVGIQEPRASTSTQPVSTMYARMERAPTPPNGTPIQLAASPRRAGILNGHSEGRAHRRQESGVSTISTQSTPQSNGSARAPSRSSRRAPTPSRPESPEATPRMPPVSVQERSTTPVRNRPNTPSSQPAIPSALRPGRGGRTNGASSVRTSASSASLVPSINVPTSPIPTRPSLQIAHTSGLSAPSSTFLTQPSPASSYAPSPEPSRASPIPPDPTSTPHHRQTSRQASRQATESGQPRRDQNRVSFFDPSNQAAVNRLLSGDAAFGDVDGENATEGDQEDKDEGALDTLESMEEMLEGYEWASDNVLERKSVSGTADQIEARLLDELSALDRANVYSFIESDDRVQTVLKYLDEALAELDGMESTVSSYKIYLNAVNEDITYIQSQNRGLQVQIQNQRALLSELEELLQTVHVDKDTMSILTQESLEKPTGIQRIEGAAADLYKALQASRDRDMAATMERLEEYRDFNTRFCNRLLDYMTIMFTAQADAILGNNNGLGRDSKGRPFIVDHGTMEQYLGRYAGLMLYVKEMEENMYGKICAAYFHTASTLHGTQLRSMMSVGNGLVRKSIDEDAEDFSAGAPASTASKAASGLRRAGTIVRAPLESRRERKDQAAGDMGVSDVFSLVLEQIALTVYREEDFIADFLQINDAGLTFADYMGLENYFRRQATRFSGLSQATLKLARGAMDLIFGFLPAELKTWLDGALAKDKLQIVGMIVSLERFLVEAEESGHAFLLNVLEKQHIRLKAIFSGRVNERIKSIEETKLTSKKRNGVAPFIKYFPTYVARIENQLVGAETLEIRQTVDAAYERIVTSMFDALRTMAKASDDDEDKGQLNYHVILIENMHYFVAEVSQLQIPSVETFLKRSQSIYEENLNAYVKMVLRRPFTKIIDYFEGVERLLQTTAPSEVASNGSYSKSALKKVVRDYDAKDVRKHIDALFKRVEKHFTEASEKATTEDTSASTGIASGTVMVGVWKACEEELLRITELFSKRIAQCYKDTGVALEYSPADVETAFKRHRVGV